MRKAKLVTNHVYHIYNRGVDKREVFLDESYYSRFVSLLSHDLRYNYAYSLLQRRLERAGSPEGKRAVLVRLELYAIEPPVEIISFCLMPNHYHLTLRQLSEKGITAFMHRLGLGYTAYFNIRQERTGRLFESTYKSVLVESEAQLLHLTRYHHLNPTSLGAKTHEELVNYPWSSLSTYLGKERFPFVKSKGVLAAFKNPKSYLDFISAEVDKYEPLRLQEITVDDDFGWFANFRALEKERRDHLREQYFTAAV